MKKIEDKCSCLEVPKIIKVQIEGLIENAISLNYHTVTIVGNETDVSVFCRFDIDDTIEILEECINKLRANK